MECQRIINLIENTTNQHSKVLTKNWFGLNYDACGIYNKNSQINFKTTMLNSSFYDYSDTCLLAQRTMTVFGQGVDAAAIAADRNNKQVAFKNCAPFTDCNSKINKYKLIMLKILM